jgi:hypothetical protein
MVALKGLFFLATLVGANAFGFDRRAAVSKNVNATLKDFEAIKTNIQAVTTALDNYSGGFFAATPIVPKIAALDSSILTAAEATAGLKGLTLTEAASVISGITAMKDPVTELLAALAANADALHNAK